MPAVPDPHDLLALAVTIAADVAAMHQDGAGRMRTTVETKTTRTDMVTEMDRGSEALIAARLREARPDDGLVGEEGTADDGTSGVRWIFDPLDGTTNYLYGYPSYACSIAVEVDGAVVAGVVHDSARDEVFTAVRGAGAHLGTRRLTAEGPPDLATALVGTGFGYDAARRARQAAVLTHVLPVIRDIRRGGAAAVDLCSVACGRLDAFYERSLQPWDHAAGALIATEAGLVVGTLDGGEARDDVLVAAPPQLFEPLLGLLRAAENLAP